MELQNELLEEKTEIKKRNKKGILNKIFQYNEQDMDQEQKVYVNPAQVNSQNLHIHIISDLDKYCGKITGTTYYEKSKEIVPNAKIQLFFGCESKLPVYTTSSDENGNFTIEEIPPGYYTILAEHGESLFYRSHFIKVLPGQTVHQSILLNR